jgi:two-component system, cell cycle response regulator DivK
MAQFLPKRCGSSPCTIVHGLCVYSPDNKVRALRVRISASAVEETRTMAQILVVEDDEENWDMISRRLQRRGYRVVHAADGQEAVEMAARERPDLILMDVGLPVMDGLEATRRIRAHTETQTTPIIALTAHAMLGDRDRALQAGCDDYHAKPVELPRLLAQMEVLLARATPG